MMVSPPREDYPVPGGEADDTFDASTHPRGPGILGVAPQRNSRAITGVNYILSYRKLKPY